MAKPWFIEDERGLGWVVYEGDPCGPLCALLHRRGVREIVLPRSAVVKGVDGLTITPAYATMSRWDVTNPALAKLLRRRVRLDDCVRYLLGGTLHQDSEGSGLV